MALGPQLLTDLIQLQREGRLPSGRNVIEIGAQQLSNHFLRERSDLDVLFKALGRRSVSFGAAPALPTGPDYIERLPDEAPSSRIFWEALGYKYSAVEFDGHRDSIPLDLNQDLVPARLRSAFDLVVNCGTTEHVANQANAFKAIHDLVKPGGLMIHDLPAGGMPTHGLFAYNMQFFFVLCRENNYNVLDLGLVYCGRAPFPADIFDSNARFAQLASHQDPRYSLPFDRDVGHSLFNIRAVLRKPADAAFVTPLDLPAELAERVKGANRR